VLSSLSASMTTYFLWKQNMPNDTTTSSSANDTITAAAGSDTTIASTGNDTVNGGVSSDQMAGAFKDGFFAGYGAGYEDGDAGNDSDVGTAYTDELATH